jgi:hypothetical protein
MITDKEWEQKVSKREGKKVQVSIGNVREIKKVIFVEAAIEAFERGIEVQETGMITLLVEHAELELKELRRKYAREHAGKGTSDAPEQEGSPES